MARQRVGQEWPGPTPGWVLIRCGVCARRWSSEPGRIIGEALGRQVITTWWDVPLDMMEDWQDESWGGDPVLPSPEDYEPYVRTWKPKSFGLLRQILHGGPRFDADALRVEVKATNPMADDEQLKDLYIQALNGRRSTESTRAATFVVLDASGAKSSLYCGRCKTTHQVGRKQLDHLVDKARAEGRSLLLTPGPGLSLL